MSDETRGNGIEHLLQDEAANGGDCDNSLLIVARPPVGERLQRGALGIYASRLATGFGRDLCVDEAPIIGKVGKVARTAQQQRILDGGFNMAVRALDGPILMRDA